MLNKIDQEFSFVQTALSLRARRQEVLASNLANADTPNYKARDLDFAGALRSALGGGVGPVKLATTSARHLGGMGVGSGATGAGLLYRQPLQPSLDGNTVDPDIERAQFTENALQYQFLLERMRSATEKLKTAFSEGR